MVALPKSKLIVKMSSDCGSEKKKSGQPGYAYQKIYRCYNDEPGECMSIWHGDDSSFKVIFSTSDCFYNGCTGVAIREIMEGEKIFGYLTSLIVPDPDSDTKDFYNPKKGFTEKFHEFVESYKDLEIKLEKTQLHYFLLGKE